jgi:phage terminase small subunit
MTKSRGIGRGGARAGAGAKPKKPQKLVIAAPIAAPVEYKEPVLLDIPAPVLDSLAHKDPKIFLLALMNDIEADVKLRSDAAKALMPFMHKKLGEGGTKEQKKDAAKVAGRGRFGAVTPPRLVANNG